MACAGTADLMSLLQEYLGKEPPPVAYRGAMSRS
jgi:hypothetical protein